LPLSTLHEHLAQFGAAGRELRTVTLRDLAAGTATPAQIQRLNQQLLQVESGWLDPAGIPGRPWFQHLLYAARYTYAHLEFPGLTEAAEKSDWPAAREQVALLEAAVEKNAQLLRQARADLEKAQGLEKAQR